jgi:hypothetical protein
MRQGTPDVIVEYGDAFFKRKSDDQLLIGNVFILDEQTWGEMCAGYRCAWCLHVQSEAWPEFCEFGGTWQGVTKHCHDFATEADPYRGLIRDHQMEYLSQELKARHDFNPPDPDDVIDREQEDWKPSAGGLLVPRDLDEQAARDAVERNTDRLDGS